MAERKSAEVQRMMQQMSEVHGGMGAVLDLLEKIVAKLEQSPQPPKDLVASPEQLYPGLHAAPPVSATEAVVAQPAPPPRWGRWGRRLFPARESHE